MLDELLQYFNLLVDVFVFVDNEFDKTFEDHWLSDFEPLSFFMLMKLFGKLLK